MIWELFPAPERKFIEYARLPARNRTAGGPQYLMKPFANSDAARRCEIPQTLNPG